MLAVLGLVVLAGVSIIWNTLSLGIGPVPSTPRVRKAVLAMVPSTLEGELHELGAGWGGLALALARHCPRARVIAWERSLVPFLVLLVRQKLGVANLEVRYADFFTARFEQATAIVCYLFPEAMRRLDPCLRASCRRDTLIVSHTFALRGWEPVETSVVEDLYRTPVYR
jgi:predicted RNA methylase